MDKKDIVINVHLNHGQSRQRSFLNNKPGLNNKWIANTSQSVMAFVAAFHFFCF